MGIGLGSRKEETEPGTTDVVSDLLSRPARMRRSSAVTHGAARFMLDHDSSDHDCTYPACELAPIDPVAQTAIEAQWAAKPVRPDDWTPGSWSMAWDNESPALQSGAGRVTNKPKGP